ncbi:tripartite tricarboxylate transporter TctB family protein [Virgibacillus dakarensis]|nr:tripartite tricarboxylate transporter TctB family protein [Virgibacillus dakarensis]
MGGIIFNFILLVVFSVFLKMSFDIEDLREVDPLGAAGFPKIILILLVIFLLISLINTIKEYVKNKDENMSNISKKSIFMVVSLVILIGLFILVLDKIGFFFSILLLTPSILLALGERKRLVLILLTIFTPIVFTILFGVTLSIPLPRGIGIFMEISRLIY